MKPVKKINQSTLKLLNILNADTIFITNKLTTIWILNNIKPLVWLIFSVDALTFSFDSIFGSKWQNSVNFNHQRKIQPISKDNILIKCKRSSRAQKRCRFLTQRLSKVLHRFTKTNDRLTEEPDPGRHHPGKSAKNPESWLWRFKTADGGKTRRATFFFTLKTVGGMKLLRWWLVSL